MAEVVANKNIDDNLVSVLKSKGVKKASEFLIEHNTLKDAYVCMTGEGVLFCCVVFNGKIDSTFNLNDVGYVAGRSLYKEVATDIEDVFLEIDRSYDREAKRIIFDEISESMVDTSMSVKMLEKNLGKKLEETVGTWCAAVVLERINFYRLYRDINRQQVLCIRY